ncbi:MAG: PKD domain-containing protein [Bacteroidia bacterium]
MAYAGFLLPLLILAQSYTLIRERHFFAGTALHETPTCSAYDGEGRLFIGGHALPTAAGLPDGWLVSLSAQGEVLWRLTLGGLGPERITDLALDDSVVYFCGSSGSALNHPEELPLERRSDYWVGAVHKHTGRLLWQARWGSPLPDEALSLCLTTYHGLLVVGYTWGVPETTMQATIFLLNTVTGEVRERRVWGPAPSLLRKVRPISGTGLYVCIGEQAYKPVVGALDYTGQIIWRTVLQRYPLPSALYALYGSTEGQIWVGGRYGTRWCLLALEPTAGRVVREYIWPESSPTGALSALTEGAEGVLFAIGWIFSTTLQSPEQKGGEDIWLVAFAKEGKVLWERGFGGPQDERGIALLVLPSGLALIAAKENRFSEHPANADSWVLLLKQVPCAEIPLTLRTDAPSFREKAGKPIRFWVEAPAEYSLSKVVWDFGDGSTAEGLEVSHIYGMTGTYTVRSTCYLHHGCAAGIDLPPILLRITRP